MRGGNGGGSGQSAEGVRDKGVERWAERVHEQRRRRQTQAAAGGGGGGGWW